jgi:hypothetical protein
MGFNGDLYGIPSGWWYTYSSEKYEFVSWDDDIPNNNGHSKKPWNPNHQPEDEARTDFSHKANVRSRFSQMFEAASPSPFLWEGIFILSPWAPPNGGPLLSWRAVWCRGRPLG